MTKLLKVSDVERICFQLAKKLMTWNEPIPDFSTRSGGILESCLMAPLASFGKKSLYPTLSNKAAILFYLLVKNHPFLNGNKRIAITSLLTFLYINHKWLSVGNERFYKMAVWVAESDPDFKDGVIRALTDFIGKNAKKANLTGIK
jgi:death-on-curing family protein